MRPKWLEAGLIRKQELMNAIWSYASLYHATAQADRWKGSTMAALFPEPDEICPDIRGQGDHMLRRSLRFELPHGAVTVFFCVQKGSTQMNVKQID